MSYSRTILLQSAKVEALDGNLFIFYKILKLQNLKNEPDRNMIAYSSGLSLFLPTQTT